jgi:adenine-specific DNA-methyltransferase
VADTGIGSVVLDGNLTYGNNLHAPKVRLRCVLPGKGREPLSRLTDLIARAKAKDSALGEELEREFKVLSSRRAFGLNFERHRPQSVELPGRPVRKGDKVRILPPRGSTKRGDQGLWKVRRIENTDGSRVAHLDLLDTIEAEVAEVAVDDLVVVAEFRDYIYPGLVSTGKVERGGDKPFQTVINGENFHALEALSYTHRGKIDAVYIDPPYNTGARDWKYNTGARDWKYNNDYVEAEDLYRHSKWLAMMERRLKVAKALLKPEDSVLIVTIDETEYLRLGLLLEQVFLEARIQMVSVSINPAAVARAGYFGRSDEYYLFLMFGRAGVKAIRLSEEWITTKGRTHKGMYAGTCCESLVLARTEKGIQKHPKMENAFIASASQSVWGQRDTT